jgi:hypothetical protein
MPVKTYFGFGISSKLLRKLFNSRCLKIKSGIIGKPETQSPYAWLIALSGSQVTKRILVGEFNAVFDCHFKIVLVLCQFHPGAA